VELHFKRMSGQRLAPVSSIRLSKDHHVCVIGSGMDPIANHSVLVLRRVRHQNIP
jgi:hypothetical protein